MSIKLRSKRLSDGSESLYLDIYYKGNRRYEFLDLKIRKNDPERKQKKLTAERIKSKRESELYSNYYDIPNISNGSTNFFEYFDLKGKDKKYGSSLNKFEEFSHTKTNGRVLTFSNITEQYCEEYKTWLLENLSNNTAWTYIIKFKTVLNKAVRAKIIPTSPAKYISVKFEEVEKIYLTYDELQRLNKVETKYTLYKYAFMFACYTGLRISDIKALSWGQIRDGKIFIRQKKTKGMEYLPLSETAKKILNDIEREDINNLEEKVFKIEKKKTERIGDKIREMAKEAKIGKYITFHTARHTYATLLISSGVDLYTVSKLLGHKSIKMTEIYANIINAKADEAVSRLPSL